MASDGGAGDVDEGWRSRPRSLPYSAPMAAPPQTQLQMFSSSPLVDPDRSGYGSTAGGKLRAIRRTGRRNTNPYERPAVGRHASAGPQAAVLISNGGVTAAQALADKRRGAWLTTGITKIITTNEAQPVGTEEQVSTPSGESNDAEAVSRSDDDVEEQAVAQEPASNTQVDIERLLQQKTLSGEEFERLSALLRSRVINSGVERKKQASQGDRETRPSHQENQPAAAVQTDAQRWRQDLQKSREERENGVRTLTVYEIGAPASATPIAAAESLDNLSSSPVDVAIAFMGRRVSRPPGSSSPAEPLNRRDENLVSTGPPSLVMSQATLSKWAPPDFGDEEQFRTPAPPSAKIRSRNQVFSRTPYSRPQRLQSSRERALDGSFGTPSSSRWTPIRTPVTGGREMLKRRSTALDDSYASVGPIRRTRQKAFISPAPISTRGSAYQITSTSGSAIMGIPSPQLGKSAALPTSQRSVVSTAVQEKSGLGVSAISYVPAQSSETARKILETLEKMTPSPKGKSLEEELSFVRDRPPTTLTESMLNEQARKSMTVVDFTLPSGDSREPGPSGRTLNYDSPSLGQFGSGSKSSEIPAKPKGKGKSSLSLPENGPSGIQSIQERKNTAAGLLEEVSVRTKESEAVLASKSDKGKGFRMSAAFEESGSEDEGTLAGSGSRPVSFSVPSLAGSNGKTASASGKSVPIAAPFSTSSAIPKSSTDASVAADSTGAASAVEASKTTPPTQMASSFTFPTRVSLEGPPTPKAMSPASTSPKAVPAASPFFPFASNLQGSSGLATSNSRVEQTSAAVKVDTQTETKSDVTFGSSITASVPFPQPFSISQPTTETTVPNPFTQRNPLFGGSSSSTLLSTSSTPNSGAATSSALASSASAASTLKSDSSPSTSGFVASLKEGSAPFTFTPTASTYLFGAGPAAASSSSGTALSSSFLGISSGPATSSSPAAGSAAFGQSNISSFESPAPKPALNVAPEAPAVVSKSNGAPSLDVERPHKRSAPTIEQDSSKRQPSVVATPSSSFAAFGSSVVSTTASTAIPLTFAAASTSAASSQNLFTASTFGQPPRESQSSAASMSTTLSPSPSPSPPPFLFGTPPSTTAALTPSSSAPGFNSTPSFPSFTGSVFGSSTSGSTFGVTPAATPMSFGAASSAPAFGSTTPKPAFGSFGSEASSQSPSIPVFGSGFSAAPTQSPASTPTYSFGGSSSQAFPVSFAASAASSASGSAFPFGSTSSFPFAANKTPSSSPAPSIFGLSSSVSAFGSTTNGSMASDVVVNDHSNMEDSMAEEPPQIAASMPSQPSSPFGGQSAAGASSFVFGAQTGTPPAPPALFGFPSQPNAAGGFAANPFAAAAAAAQSPAGPLNFAGGSFTLGSSGGDNRPTRKIFKAKRTGAKRGK
ncbi:hypothetical protein AXG93_2016s1380 [Marchantia polymorpha subsp. ruderalis]|uniref:Nuclear pore complex protein NUP1 n=1 Tax=Marchantia polymorpha subsp. ruderalis TaxID=1480154 RepID=A0A176VWF2_MARPO|nr:hypothetical protein AXG93_2016s1380 [Marchantia polymorpha subsp. ruderalis]